jgi:hypothetical protein
MKVIVLILVVLVAISLYVRADWEKPSFCHELDCPMYETIVEQGDYTIRKYKSSRWVSTVVQDAHFHTAAYKGFMRLLKYLTGGNLDKKDIEMTTPVHTKIIQDKTSGKQNFTISFYLPYEYQTQEHVPEPLTDSGVFISTMPEHKVAVWEFGGFILRENDYSVRAALLRNKLDDDAVAYHSESLEVCGYDSPTTMHDRHNEVWILLK